MLRSDEARFVGDGHERGAVAAAELAQDVADVRLGRERADDESSRDLVVREAFGHEPRDLALAAGELGEGSRRLGRVGPGCELGDQALGDTGGQERIAGGDDLDGEQKLPRRGVLE
jgi:hypothetical protein